MAQAPFEMDAVDAASLATVGNGVNRSAYRGSRRIRGTAGSNRSGVAIAAGTQCFFSTVLNGFPGEVVAILIAHTLRHRREATMKPLRNRGEIRRVAESEMETAVNCFVIEPMRMLRVEKNVVGDGRQSNQSTVAT